MSSKVTAKLPLGAAFSVLLISLALLAGCKQEAPVDNSYTPPGYGASVGSLTDTVWKNDSGTIRFGAEGKVVDVPKEWKTDNFGNEYGDFTYSDGKIFAKFKKLGELAEYLGVRVGTISERATFTVPRTASIQDGSGSPTIKKMYYEMDVTIEGELTPDTFTMENKPTSGDKFVGTYYDTQGRKKIQINTDNTFVTFTNGGQFIEYWKYNGDGTISVDEKPFDSSNSNQTGTIHYLYPHALMSDGSTVYYK